MRKRILAHIIKVMGGSGPHWGKRKTCIIKIFKATGQDGSKYKYGHAFAKYYYMIIKICVHYFNSGFDYTSTVFKMEHPRRKGH